MRFLELSKLHSNLPIVRLSLSPHGEPGFLVVLPYLPHSNLIHTYVIKGISNDRKTMIMMCGSAAPGITFWSVFLRVLVFVVSKG